MRRMRLDPDALHVESFRGESIPIFGFGDPAPPANDTGCTDECMSGESLCPILSCGSDCDPSDPCAV